MGVGAEGAPKAGVRPKADGIKEGIEKEIPPKPETGDMIGAVPVAEAAGAFLMDCAAAYGARPGQAAMRDRQTAEERTRRSGKWFMPQSYESVGSV